MSLILALGCGWAACALSRRWLAERGSIFLGIGAGLATVHPALGIGALVVTVMLLLRGRLMERRRDADRARKDLSLLGELLLTGLTAGLSLTAALELAAGEVAPALAAELGELLRAARRGGLAAALSSTLGYGSRLYLLLARAHLTGAPAAEGVASFVHEQRDRERVRSLEAARRLPVRLMIPLALLILPGFAVLTVGPSVLGSVRRLGSLEVFELTLPPVVGRMPT